MKSKVFLITASAIVCAWLTIAATDGTAPTAASCEVLSSSSGPEAPRDLRIIRNLASVVVAGREDMSGPNRDSEPSEPEQASARHAYFLALTSRPDCARAYSLRDARQLDHPKNGGFAHSNKRALAVTYDPANDPDPRRQDAAKVLIRATSNSLPNQVRLPIPGGNKGEPLLVTWDVWYGSEFRYEHAQIDGYKAFMFSAPGMTNIWTEIRTRNRLGSRIEPATTNHVGMTDVRFYGHKANGYLGPSGEKYPNGLRLNGVNYGGEALGPMIADFRVAPETWTRYWAFFDFDGEWYPFSLWLADENRGPVQLINAAQIKPQVKPASPERGWEGFWLEFDTSSNEVVEGRGPLTAYVRNVVMLKGIKDVSPLLERPRR